MSEEEPRTIAQMQDQYLSWLRKCNGQSADARVHAGVTYDLVRGWRRDEGFARREGKIVRLPKQKLRKKVDQILEAVDEEGLPKFPQHVMTAAKAQLPEFKPQDATINHNVAGSVSVDHMHMLEHMPDNLLEEFIQTGRSAIEMDRIAEDIWSQKKPK